MAEDLQLVNEHDLPAGTMTKLEVHRRGLLHRAFSVFILDTHGKHLLQQRAPGKYHSGSLWTNTCCGHPAPGQETIDAAKTRLKEEMGIECDLKPLMVFHYKENLDNSLIENEIDHVYYGVSSSEPIVNPDEVMDWKWENSKEVLYSLNAHPELYTVWFRQLFPQIHKMLENEKVNRSAFDQGQ